MFIIRVKHILIRAVYYQCRTFPQVNIIMYELAESLSLQETFFETYATHLLECSGRAVECIGLKFWCCQNVGSNPGLAGRGAQLSKTLSHNCFVLRMGRKAVGPVCCAMHVKEPRTLIVKEKGACPGVSGFAP